jgi:hypothetical protein
VHSTYPAVNTAAGTAHLVVRVAQRITLTSDESALHVPGWRVNAVAYGIISVGCSACLGMCYTQATTSRTLVLSASC